MTKKLILMMGILGILFGCKSKVKDVDEPATPTSTPSTLTQKMPEGQLLGVNYFYQGMMMEEFGNFDLHRDAVGKTAELSFRHFNNDESHEVSDTLFDAARRIIEEEKMYEYAPHYSLKMDERILDGYMWGFGAHFEGNERIISGGDNVSPNGNGLNKIRNLLYDAAKRVAKDDE